MVSASAYRAGEIAARHAPAALSLAATRLASWGAAAVSRDRRVLVRRNLERVKGRALSRSEELRAVAEVFEWYGRYYLESLRLPSLSKAEIDSGFRHEGFEIVERAVRSGAGTILVLPHLGSWEWAAWWMSLVPRMKVTALVERLEPPEVFEWFLSYRRRLGMNLIVVGPDAGRLAIEAVKRGDVLCVMSDRDVVGSGVPVTFFGERTRLPAGPALMALRTGAALIPAAVYWRDGIHHGVVRPALSCRRLGSVREDTSRLVQRYAEELEGLIRLAPEQWHLMSPNWPSDYRALGQAVPEILSGL